MPTRTISQTFKVGSTLTDVTTAKLSDPTGAFGIRRDDTLAVVVADGTNMTHDSTGVYSYTFTAVDGVAYTAYIEFVYNGDTIYKEVDIPATSSEGTMACSYSSLLSRVGHELFGIRSGYSSDQTTDILQCIQDGLNYVYDAHDWSFFKPIKDVSTTAPYATGTVTIVAGVVTLAGGTWPSWAAAGILRVSNSYYSIASRDSSTQLTLNDTSATAAALTTFSLGRPEVDLPTAFEAISPDGQMTYYPDPNTWWPEVRPRHDQHLRALQQASPYYSRPAYYSIRTVEFDPTVGSRKRLAFYPVPDAQYVLRVPCILRPTMIDATNQYPVGGETLAQLIIEACLSAVELDYYEKLDGRHTLKFQQMLPLAIRADQEKSSPTSLGPDRPAGEYYYCGDSDYERARRMNDVTLDGVAL